ncbi:MULTISPECIES: 3'-5' exoribonuclease YhaM [Staphylococcus]|jgi:3'-5' exoribonuclease|uniref:3'-5' exoribonuclease YhaM n=2 Tax=Staphylococcus TaxID=1279 RepID=A0A1L8Y6E9_STAHO|nr:MULTISPECIES: 3'-5' exoribonuclease YhaM [Staphylococcus]EUZ67582.1 cmp-binding-factor 1 [Staphylococcus sp. M0480]OFK81384.1 3'-5' exonuclease [Staphylococcus sp. HMSC057A02]OFM63012.1 3'-5' exonuclease [Staphylococcus sp. HMSC062C01]OFM63335.1 3'-5' exonuclease [Staphylococcus sp. HMSC068D07]OFM75762.1 3'-5' exonuclease [Staphylococcus sp. HMSC074B09]OFN10702.1 3'-5' exonuclease [Staphylococcus sp. HMSC058D09]OFR09580.1 3'-5' exonuclease [Staphylococcus sp. HMSC078E07]OFS49044.1 3'-5' 
MRNVEKLNPGDSVENFFLIHRATQGVTAQGKDYMTLYLQDKSGDIEAKLWTVTKDDMKILKPEIIVWVKGDVINYRGRKQMKVNQFRLATAEDGVKTQDFVDGAPLSPNEIQDELSHFILEIENAHLQRITRHLLKKYQDKFFTYPAASSHHHNFAGGLSYHVLTMLKIAKSLCDIYPLLNRSLLYSAIILHDIGKVRELSGPVATTYTVEGNLLGHISIASDEVAEAAKELGIDSEEVMLLRHMILAHHGKMEFGSPKLPHLKEAEILFFIDNIDAKMNMFDKAFKKTEKGQFTERIFGMDNRQFYNPEKLD